MSSLNLVDFVRGIAPTSYAVDSRLVQPGALFVALRGAQTDGHAFLQSAQSAGAVAAIVEEIVPADLPQFVVSDALEALAELARLRLADLKGVQVFGITGTVGKTTAKDMLAHLLGGPPAQVHAAPASYNSEIGLPLAILSAPRDTQKLVLEFGISHAGDMSPLTAIVNPAIVWFTALTQVHLDGFNSFKELIAEKTKLMHGQVPPEYIWGEPSVLDAVREAIPNDCVKERVLNLCERSLQGLPGEWQLNLAPFGLVDLPVVAYHEAVLAATAASIALDVGIALTEIRARLNSLPRPSGRLEWHKMGTISILNDAYNASPASMRAALEVLAQCPTQGRRIAVLGTMREMGDAALSLHQEIGRFAATLSLDLIVGIGDFAEAYVSPSRAAGTQVFLASDVDEFTKTFAPQLRQHDFLLLKASRAEAFEKSLPELKASANHLAQRPETTT
ncbi:MAG: UDP-N-acetylmuramoyl-tripeptide--D-alanyl-D-alanine ligase [Planctomycetes bacterium]|jgi:UDP-N-acetylmuramoyl-tripeptide--D-alanyl-D-alanine ligase|nr:UDP-N-acetylmuramoyl-tripeptide--D-alanyl-D-alanine ligase [Planctomycetota bacterium]MBT4028353.1 UDP-N-acetylmuramoyl-tripeptide--D-alanyl-D-alanine ligase [Planctomycetota bacterium]MBT5101266.1 UDP-N-acetylmuramoyl-tripeptide--D-alanyl-D-alanine ligase [Planctomycetota bacterium]